MAISLPIYIQNEVIKLVYKFDTRDIYDGVALVCWRWFHYVSGLVDTALVFRPMLSSSYTLQDLYQHTTSRYCIFKGIKVITLRRLDASPTEQFHTKEMMENHEWVRSFYGSLKFLIIQIGDHTHLSLEYYQELFGEILKNTQLYYKEKEKETKNENTDKECIKGEGEDIHKVVELKDLILQAHSPNTIPLMPMFIELIVPYCQRLTKLHLYIERYHDITFIFNFLKQLPSIRYIYLCLKVSPEDGNIVIPKVLESLADTVESLILNINTHTIPFKLLSRFPNLNSIGLVVYQCLKEFTDFIMNNNTITNLEETSIEYTQDTSPIFKQKVDILRFTISFRRSNHYAESLSQMENPDIQLHPKITTLSLEPHRYSANIVRAIVKQCPQLHTLNISPMVIGMDLFNSLIETIQISTSLGMLHLDASSIDDLELGDITITPNQFIDLFNAVSQSKKMEYILINFSPDVPIEFPQPDPSYDGWNIRIDQSDLSVSMWRKTDEDDEVGIKNQ